jgi:hypothetical protein
MRRPSSSASANLAALVALAALLGLPAAARGAKQTFESVQKKSEKIYSFKHLKSILRPFVATCTRKKKQYRRLFCMALNERLKAQHQTKTYRITREPSAAGPLIVKFKARPKPTMEIQIKGCLTCKEPLLDRKGGNISDARFFLFKVPKEIKIRRGKVLYDLGDIDIDVIRVPLPKGTTRKKFKAEILPHLRLDLVFRPVAGVTKVGKRFKYGVINFELVAHRAYHKCKGKLYSVAPKMAGKFVVDKNDLSCPQNQPKKAVARAKLPSTLPQGKVKALMELVSGDLQACYEQYGVGGQVPTDIVVSPIGKVKHVKVVGKLANTPTGKCVERLVKNISFPKFSGDDARLQWPFALRN